MGAEIEPSIVRYYAARFFCYFVRFGALRIARWTFKNGSTGTVLRRKFCGNTIILPVRKSNVQKLLWLQGERYVREAVLLAPLIEPGMTIIDVGANIGYYALIFAKRLNNKGRLVCVEPEPQNLSQLRQTIRSSELDSLVSVEECAAGDADGELRMEPGLNGLVSKSGSLRVKSRRIDSFQMGKVDLVKIDVEGFEGAVLDGATTTIREFQPSLFIELHPVLLTNHSHRGIVETLSVVYRNVKMYRPRRGNIAQRLAAAYSIVSGIERCNLDYELEQFEQRKCSEPRWIVAQS